ncbi:hypothetical protein P152DRAFT_459592 [Eremomyces bilateralis CBS 781.70]|uniref:SPIN90/Ldb17 leucine-rich domain-containing protein n=1 Tax=Eremomyces bilateralis CBS 781.70 TaxID=1392243 RepID=A0A6G1FZA9_9PEZI|nr:uncharacterized protein P152DRAFT_459592 [Eremomyces bilateralis CBS 781.70]KAF1811187.1 hypothetical protein P152DRAFT_459592 [Eremomyces bilateralis CBS 781.70]
MEIEVSYNLESEQQFWAELDDIVSKHCNEPELIDDALRSYLHFTTHFKDDYLQSDQDIAQCIFKFLNSSLFQPHKDYVRRQLVYSLLQEDDAPSLHVIAAILLYDGRMHDETFMMFQQEGGFPRVVELIHAPVAQNNVALHRMLLELMYEMSRIQRLDWEDLIAVGDSFIKYLFDIVEGLWYDASDPYHYSVIRVLLVLNEQYLVNSTSATVPGPAPLTNRIIKFISTYPQHKTFGENLILLLNRESETSLQLLILKLLYLIFSSLSTAEYFYTNDLHVLLDVTVRNLLDLPIDDNAAQALRHTYLRVLHPMLANSQLHRPGMHYKREEIRKMLRILVGGLPPDVDDVDSPTDSPVQDLGAGMNGAGPLYGFHFAPVDPTTRRLVKRCATVPWLRDADEPLRSETPVQEAQKDLARRMLGMSVMDGGSSVSMMEVAKHTEKPGVMTPSKVKHEEDIQVA